MFWVKTLVTVVMLIVLGVMLAASSANDPAGAGEGVTVVSGGMLYTVEAYVGLLLCCGWIAYREPPGARTLLWVAGTLGVGHLVFCIYLLLALSRSQGDWRRFWLGCNATPQ
jgi:hypothetical protein